MFCQRQFLDVRLNMSITEKKTCGMQAHKQDIQEEMHTGRQIGKDKD